MVIYGIITTTNTNDNFVNLVVKSSNETIYNIKTSRDVAATLMLNHVYEFNVIVKETTRVSYVLEKVYDVSFINSEKRDTILRSFMNHREADISVNKEKLYEYISKISNVTLRKITEKLVGDHLIDFLTYPGGKRIHHSFLGGLGYHTLGMLRLADVFLEIYPYLKKDYLYSGIILHDLGKIKEYDDVQNPEFSLEGHMLGHLVMGAMEVESVAKELGYSGCEEVLILEHILVSHHGQLQFGSAKRPITPEALMVWYIDTIDSKFDVLGDELAKINKGEFTESLQIFDKTRIYKPKLD